MSRYTCFVREISVIERYSKGQQLELFSFFSIFTRSFCNYNEDNNESRDVDVEFAFRKKKADKYEQIYIYIYSLAIGNIIHKRTFLRNFDRNVSVIR